MLLYNTISYTAWASYSLMTFLHMLANLEERTINNVDENSMLQATIKAWGVFSDLHCQKRG